MVAMLERYKCPTPYHAVRTRFIGRIASPAERIATIETIKQLWGGELPPFDSIEDFNDLLNMLINELWNELTQHQTLANPFRLTRIEVKPTREEFRNYVRVRHQEIEGFIEGLFGGNKALDFPETAHKAIDELGKMRAMLAGAENLLNDESKLCDLTTLKALIYKFQEIGKIAEREMNAAIQSCKRARNQSGVHDPIVDQTMH